MDLITTAIHEMVSRRRLIRYLVRAEIKKQGTDTVLGNIWWILDPLLSMLVYVVVMTFIFPRKTPDFPLFLLAAMIPFKWFTSTISASVTSVTAQGPLIKQIQFPKIVLPLTINGAELVNLGFGLIVLWACWSSGPSSTATRLDAGPPLADGALDPGHRRRAVRLPARPLVHGLGGHRLLP